MGGGWIVPATIEGLRDGLTEVLSGSSAIESAAAKIKKYVVGEFSWAVIVQKYWKLYSTLLGGAGNERVEKADCRS
jgi:glycosyltransferase involved in cell wall biosynthesis